MTDIEEVIKDVEQIEEILEGFLSYDSESGGLVSQSIQNMVEIKELLKNPSATNIKQALSKAQASYDVFSPYESQAPDLVSAVKSLVNKLNNLVK